MYAMLQLDVFRKSGFAVLRSLWPTVSTNQWHSRSRKFDDALIRDPHESREPGCQYCTGNALIARGGKQIPVRAQRSASTATHRLRQNRRDVSQRSVPLASQSNRYNPERFVTRAFDG